MGGSKREGHLPGQLQANNWWKLMSQIYSPAGKQNVASPKHDNKFVQISPYGKASMFVISKLFIMANRYCILYIYIYKTR